MKSTRWLRPLSQILVCCLLLGGMSVGVSAKEQTDQLRVVTTFSILADWVQEVGGDRVEVYSLVGMDEDAHVFHASPRDIQQVARADLLVWNGLGFEGWLDRVVSASSFKGQTLVASEGVDVIHLDDIRTAGSVYATPDHDAEHESHNHARHDHRHNHQNIDPHVWHSLQAAEVCVRNIEARLIALDPAHRDEYQQRAENYIARLRALQTHIADTLASVPPSRRHIVVPHNAFAYLGREFDLEIFSLQGVTTSAEASASDMAKVIDIVRKHSIKAIFSENISNTRLIERVQQETGLRLGGDLISGALSKAKAPTYLDMMEHNLKLIVQTLNAPESS